MGFPDNVLAKGEKVERALHPHWLTVVVPTIFGVLLTAACIAVVIQTPDDETGNRIQWIAVAVLVLVAIPAVVVPYLRWRTTHYVITTHRVMVRRGILTKQGKDITLSKITDVSFQQTLLDRMIRAGSLHIESAGDSPDEDLTNIPHSNVVQQLINRLIDEDDLRRRSPGRGHAPERWRLRRWRLGWWTRRWRTRRARPRRRRHDGRAAGRAPCATRARRGAPPRAA